MSTNGGETRQPCASMTRAASPAMRALDRRDLPVADRDIEAIAAVGKRGVADDQVEHRDEPTTRGPRLARACRRPRRSRPQCQTQHASRSVRQRLRRARLPRRCGPRSMTSTRSAKRAASVRSCMMARMALPRARRCAAAPSRQAGGADRVRPSARPQAAPAPAWRARGPARRAPLAAGERGDGHGPRSSVVSVIASACATAARSSGVAAENASACGARPSITIDSTVIGQWNTWPCGKYDDRARPLARAQTAERFAGERDRTSAPGRGQRARASAWSCRRRSGRPARPTRRR